MNEIKYTTYDGEEIVLNDQNIFSCFSGTASPTVAEVEKFANLCKTKRLNPFASEIWLVKYDVNRPATIMVGKDGYLVLASSDARYKGMQSGIIVRREDGSYDKRIGSFYDNGERIVGGWAKVFIDGADVPFEDSVSLNEYSSNKQMWATKPATMIQKVAIAHCLKLAFPRVYSSIYSEGEIDTDEPLETACPVEVKPKKAERKEKFIPTSEVTPEPEPVPEAKTEPVVNQETVQTFSDVQVKEPETVVKPVTEPKKAEVNAADPVQKPDEVKLTQDMELNKALATTMGGKYTFQYLLDKNGAGLTPTEKSTAMKKFNVMATWNNPQGEAVRVILAALQKGVISFKMA